jgi:HSP20 family molecular chaperone IbpA
MADTKNVELVEAEARHASAPVYTPRADVIDFADRLEIRINMPGVALKDLLVKYENNVLSVRGHRAVADANVLYREFEATSFQRTFSLPDGYDSRGITADLTNGVLLITLPKAAERRPRTIEVRNG